MTNPDNTPEIYWPGDLMIVCSCGRHFGRWPAESGPPTWKDYLMELWCSRCRVRVKPIFRQPPPHKTVQPTAA